MRVVIPYTRWNAAVEDALEATGHDWEGYDLSGSDSAYWSLLRSLWTAGETFCIIEHDIVVHPTALDELERCVHAWCGFPHEYLGEITYGMGCVKFGADLIARVPDAIDVVALMSDPRHPRRHWCRLDAWLQGWLLPWRHEAKHLHATPLVHLGRGVAHGCVPSP